MYCILSFDYFKQIVWRCHISAVAADVDSACITAGVLHHVFCPSGATLWISVAHCTLHFLHRNLSSYCTAAATIRRVASVSCVIFARHRETAFLRLPSGDQRQKITPTRGGGDRRSHRGKRKTADQVKIHDRQTFVRSRCWIVSLGPAPDERISMNERSGPVGGTIAQPSRFPRGHRNSGRPSHRTGVRLYVDGQFVERIMLPTELTSHNTRDTFCLQSNMPKVSFSRFLCRTFTLQLIYPTAALRLTVAATYLADILQQWNAKM